MAGTLEIPQEHDSVAHDQWRTGLTALFAVAASLGMLALAPSASGSPLAYWVVSSIAVVTVLIVFVAGQHVWGDMVTKAQAAGVVDDR